MNKILLVFCVSTLTLFGTTTASAGIIVFDHDFQNGTAGDLATGGSLGTPAVGTVTAPNGGFVTGTRPAFTTGSNANDNVITTVNGTFNDVGAPAGNYLTVDLSSPAAITGALGAGQTTTVDFSFASFGSNNQNAFKYSHIVGLSSTGDEVFQLLYRAGSASGTREAFAREFGEDNTTFSGTTFSSVDGDRIADNISNNNNSTNVNAAPTGQINFSITIDEFGWNAAAVPNGGSSTQTPVTVLNIDSGATDLASIQFFSSVAFAARTQNNGFHVDNIVVETDLLATSIPEPTSALALLGLTMAIGCRRRR